MESNDKLKEIDIKNSTCYYFNYMIKIEDFGLANILIDEKAYKNILVYNISNKSLIDRFIWWIDGFIRSYDRTKYLVLFGNEKYDSTYDRIRYLISVTSGIKYIISHNYATIKVDSYDSLPLEKTRTFRNVIILVKSFWNKDKNNYYYYIFLGIASYKLPKKYVFILIMYDKNGE